MNKQNKRSLKKYVNGHFFNKWKMANRELGAPGRQVSFKKEVGVRVNHLVFWFTVGLNFENLDSSVWPTVIVIRSHTNSETNYNRTSTHLIFFKSFSTYIRYKSEVRYDWKKCILCAITVFVTKNAKYKKGNTKKIQMTISYFIPLVTKIYNFLGDDEVVPSIDPDEVCQVLPFTCIH